METIKFKELIRRISLREICYVCLCIIIFYLFRAKDSYRLVPTWRKRSESNFFMNGQFPREDEKLPSPLVTDLEGDGINEVVMVTADGRLSVLSLPEHQKTDDGSLPHVVIKQDVALQLRRPERIAQPVILQTGFTVPYQSMIQIRKQIIVIVTDDWHVMCFDPDLTLLWEAALPLPVDLLDEAFSVKSLGVLIISHSVQKNSGGLVIVGGSFAHKTHHTKELPVEKIDEEGNRTVELKSIVEEQENLTHFSTFALSASDGTVHWHHLPGDFGEQKHNINNHVTEHHWKLGLRKNRKHAGQAHWKLYSKEFSHHLPHMWVSNQHTSFTLGRFAKDQKSNVPDGDDEGGSSSTRIQALSAHHIVGYAYGGQRPHSETEHAASPNAVVIQGPHGIEVLSLLSGQPITHLEFPETNDIHIDIDGDGECESLVWDLGKGHTVCYLDIWRVLPVKEKLDQISLCVAQRMIWQHSWAMEEDIFKKVPPVLIKSVAKKGGLLRHLLGHHLTKDESFDLLNFGAVGRMTSRDLAGTVHWQVQTPAKWSELSIKLRRKSVENVPEEVEEEFKQSFSPGFILFPLEDSDRKNTAAVVGLSSLALVDLADGSLLAQHSIPAPPTQPLVYGDFDNDGINDVILICKKGFIGFTVKKQTNFQYSILYASAVLLSILFVTWLLTQPSEFSSEEKSR